MIANPSKNALYILSPLMESKGELEFSADESLALFQKEKATPSPPQLSHLVSLLR